MFKIDIAHYCKKIIWYAIFIDMNVFSSRVTGVANMSHIKITPFSLLFYVSSIVSNSWLPLRPCEVVLFRSRVIETCCFAIYDDFLVLF